MTQRILLLSGRKQSGKTTTCNFLHGYLMKRLGITKDFTLNEKGDLLVYSEVKDGDEVTSGMGIFDLDRVDPEFVNYLRQRIWPFVKSYSFADELKAICMSLFGLSYKQCYGTDDDKNTESQIKWSDISFALPPRTVGQIKKKGKLDSFLTSRELLQQFGTNICRKIFNDCWVVNCYNNVVMEGVPFSIICDGRFPNEVDVGDNYDVKTIRFERSPHTDEHDSEKALDNYKWNPDNHFVLDNSEMSIFEQNQAVLSQLVRWGWIPEDDE